MLVARKTVAATPSLRRWVEACCLRRSQWGCPATLALEGHARGGFYQDLPVGVLDEAESLP